MHHSFLSFPTSVKHLVLKPKPRFVLFYQYNYCNMIGNWSIKSIVMTCVSTSGIFLKGLSISYLN